MKGVQFVLSKYFMDRNLFWIEKRLRSSPSEFKVISVYYVLDFVIYQAPTLASIINTRINNSIFFTKKAFEIVEKSSEILYSKPSSWKSINAKSDETRGKLHSHFAISSP